jgi:hypothetical protein
VRGRYDEDGLEYAYLFCLFSKILSAGVAVKHGNEGCIRSLCIVMSVM